MLILKRHYVAHYRQLRKEFLLLEVSMTYGSLVRSTISYISKKDVSCANQKY
jgi:hypothetical protein